MFLLLVACVRWPAVLFHISDTFDGFEPRSSTASDWCAFLVRLLRFASGNPWPAMFKEISQGRNRCYTGLLWLCKTLGIVSALDEPRDGDDVVILGLSQKKYLVADIAVGSQRLQQVLLGVQVAGLALPDTVASSQDILSFSSRIMTLVGLIVGRESHMSRGYVSRVLLSMLQREHGIDVWDCLTMSDLSELLPDENCHLGPLLHMSARSVRTRFGISPLALSGVACLWGTVNPAHLHVLTDATSKDILNAVSAPVEEPMASSQVKASRCGRLLRSIPVPAVWVASLSRRRAEIGS